MDQIKQEICGIREEVATLRAEVEKWSDLVKLLAAAQIPPLFQQRPQQQCQQKPRQRVYQQSDPLNRVQRKPQFDPIPMTYAELLPTLLEEKLIQTRTLPQMPEMLPSWYRPDLSCAFHQGPPGHDAEHFYALKAEVQKLIQANILSFKGSSPIVQDQGTPSIAVDVLSFTH